MNSRADTFTDGKRVFQPGVLVRVKGRGSRTYQFKWASFSKAGAVSLMLVDPVDHCYVAVRPAEAIIRRK